MTDLAALLASTADGNQKVAAEIERLGQSAEQIWVEYLNAASGGKRAFKAVWEAAVRRGEAVRREQDALLVLRLSLIITAS